MSCFPEQTYSIYADGELGMREARAVKLHLAVCRRCRGATNELLAENRLLKETFRQMPEDSPPVFLKETRRFDRMGAAVALLAAATLVRAAFQWLAQRELPAAVEWLNPLTSTFQWRLIFSAIFDVIERDTAALLPAGAASALLLTILFLGAGARFLARFRPAAISILAGLAMLLGLALPAQALQLKKARSVSVPSGQTLDDTLLAVGNTVPIDGVLTGDLLAVAKRIVIRGTVKGDLLSFGQDLDLEGTVGGNVYCFGRRADIRGEARSLLAFGQSVRLLSAGRTEADLLAFASDVDLDGSVGRDAMTFAGSTELRGSVGRNLTVRSDRITLASPARVGGDFAAHLRGKGNVQVEPGVTILGKRETHRKQEPARYLRPKFYFWLAVRLSAALVAGLLLRWLFPAVFSAPLQTAGAVLRNAGVGFLILVATPIAVILLAITLIGLPIAAAGLALWLLGLYLAKIFVAASIGQGIQPSAPGKAGPFALALLLGLLVVFAAIHIPYVGGVIHFLVLLLGLGMALSQLRSPWQRPRVPASA